MMVSLFSLMTIAMLLAYFKQRKLAMLIFFITLILAIFWFAHHATDVLNIQL